MEFFIGLLLGAAVCVIATIPAEKRLWTVNVQKRLQSSVGGYTKEAREKEGIG